MLYGWIFAQKTIRMKFKKYILTKFFAPFYTKWQHALQKESAFCFQGRHPGVFTGPLSNRVTFYENVIRPHLLPNFQVLKSLMFQNQRSLDTTPPPLYWYTTCLLADITNPCRGLFFLRRNENFDSMLQRVFYSKLIFQPVTQMVLSYEQLRGTIFYEQKSNICAIECPRRLCDLLENSVFSLRNTIEKLCRKFKSGPKKPFLKSLYLVSRDEHSSAKGLDYYPHF